MGWDVTMRAVLSPKDLLPKKRVVENSKAAAGDN
jgi:hypothetical protein